MANRTLNTYKLMACLRSQCDRAAQKEMLCFSGVSLLSPRERTCGMNTLIKTIEVIGIIGFALTGIYEARKKGMDIIGVYAVAISRPLEAGRCGTSS